MHLIHELCVPKKTRPTGDFVPSPQLCASVTVSACLQLLYAAQGRQYVSAGLRKKKKLAVGEGERRVAGGASHDPKSANLGFRPQPNAENSHQKSFMACAFSEL